ncbi:MAG: hypothetical protein RLZZ426_414 [Actinomycetota bacterium]|jgi:signal peptidase
MKWRSGLQRILRIGGIFGASIVLLYAAALISLRVMGFDYAVVISESMNPVAHRGDLVLINQDDKPTLNDIALFRRGDALVLHRLIAKSDEGWTSRGDANPANDPWLVQETSVVGVGVGVIKGFGTPLLWIGDHLKNTANAAWGSGTKYSYTLKSNWWSVTPTTWTMIYANSSVTYSQPATINMAGNGVRKVYSTTKYFSDVRLKAIINVTYQDVSSDWIRFVINGCADSGNVVSCGYAITLEKQIKSINLRGIKSSSSLTSPISSCTFPTNFGFTQPMKLSIKKSLNKISVSANDVVCFELSNLSQTALSAGAAPVTGGYAGVWIERYIRINLSPLQMW